MKTYIFDENGLRFSPEYLKNMAFQILSLTLEEQSEFVDNVTYERNRRAIDFIDIHDQDWIANWNTISVGNLAFTALNHPAHQQRVYAKILLNEIKKFESRR